MKAMGKEGQEEHQQVGGPRRPGREAGAAGATGGSAVPGWSGAAPEGWSGDPLAGEEGSTGAPS